MKRFVCIALFLAFILCACNEAAFESSLQESGAESAPFEESLAQDNSEFSAPQTAPSFDDYEADGDLKAKHAYDVNKLLENADLEKYSYSENLLVIGGMKSKFTFEEAFAVLELCRYTAKEQGWHE